MIIGMNRETGLPVSDLDHLRQSIRDILTTRQGTRVILRDYGGGVMGLIDAPVNAATLLDLRVAIATALDRWEPRIKVTAVDIVAVAQGQVTVDIRALYRPDNKAILVDGIIIQ